MKQPLVSSRHSLPRQFWPFVVEFMQLLLVGLGQRAHTLGSDYICHVIN